MNSIFKYLISDYADVEIPFSFQVIRVGEVEGKWYMWAKVDTDKPKVLHKVMRIDLPVLEKYTTSVPQSGQLIHAQDIEGKFYLWYIFEYMDIDKAYTAKKLVFFKTGQPIPKNLVLSPLIGTCKLFIMQELCLYVFEDLTPSAKNDKMAPVSDSYSLGE